MAVLLIFKPRELNSVADLINDMGKSKLKGKFLFRGQNVDEPLLPKIARSSNLGAQTVEDIERKMLDRFKKESSPFMQSTTPKNDWDWLSIAQHHGMPTRLLDWSANALAGLWFAVASDPPQGHEHGVLWRLLIKDENLKSPEQDVDVFGLRRTYVFQPFHIDKRIAAQSGWFSVHKYAESSERFVPLDSNSKYKSLLVKYVIPKSSFHPIRQELRMLGVTQVTMFPDLAGLCADIQSEFLGKERNAESI